MKKFLLLCLVIFSVDLFCQNINYTFSELKGMEDREGNTHLFYRKYFSQGNPTNYYTENSIYHLDIKSGADSLFLKDLSYYYLPNGFGDDQHIFDYEFWNNDPSKYIFSGGDCGIDCVGYVHRFDETLFDNIFFFDWNFKLQISKQNDSLLYSTSEHMLVKSTDGGRNWFIVDSTAIRNLLSLSPFNDNEIFVQNENNAIDKSNDGGITYHTADTSKVFDYPLPAIFYYDKDSITYYRTSCYYDGTKYISALYVSKAKGESNTWRTKYSSSNNVYLSIDDSVSGSIYLADGNKILESTDYGNTFNVYKALDSSIVGIYKKPSSSILYAATRFDIYEITPSLIKSIKHLTVDVKYDKNNLPSEYFLYQNYPNPFNPSTTIRYQIPKSGFVTLKVYDILGRETAALVNEFQTAGEHTVQFSTDDKQQTKNNKVFSSGVYFYQLKSGDYSAIKKMVLLK